MILSSNLHNQIIFNGKWRCLHAVLRTLRIDCSAKYDKRESQGCTSIFMLKYSTIYNRGS